MYKWSLLLLASAAVFQPIASFTEHKLVDGRQQCCDHQPQLLHRDTRLSVYGAIDKVSQEDRLNNRYAVPATSYEVRSAESKVSRVTESPGSRLVTSRTGRISQFSRQAADGSDFRGQSGTRSSWISNQKERNLRENRLIRSRDATARSANERRFRVSVDIRQEPRFTRDTDNIHNNRAIRENRNILQSAGNDVDRANIWNSRILRETLEQSVRDISRTRLPVDRSMMADENRRVVNDARIRKVNFNRHMIREMSYEKMSVRQTPEIRRVTNDHRREQTREDFRKEDRVEAVTGRRFAVFSVGGRQSPSYSRSDRELRQTPYVGDRRTVRSVKSSFTRNFNGERRQFVPKSLDSRSNPVLSSLETRTFLERRYVDETMNVRSKNIERHNRDMTNHERFKTQMTRIDERRNSLLDEQERKQIRRSTVERMEAKRSRRETRDISSARQGSVESLRFGRRDTRFDNRAETRNQRSFSPNQQDRRSSDRHMERNNSVRDGMTLTRQVRSVKDLRLERRDIRFNIRAEKRSNNYELESSLNERQENPRFTNRRMELSRREARERVTLTRQARSVENLKFDRRDTRFANRAETTTRNQRSFNNINELESSLNEQRQENRRSTGRRMELSRHEARERVTLARQARSVENLRFNRRDTRFANRAETTTKNQRSLTNINNVDIRRNSRNVQERQENGRSTERLMERSRNDARDGIPLTRQARSMENLRFDRKDTRFANRIETKNQRSSGDSDLGRSWNEQERRENIRFMDRQLERNRPQTFDKMTLARQVRSVESLRFDQRDTGFANRAETRNRRSSNNIRVVDVQRNSRNIQERQENRRSTERLMVRSRNDVRDGIPLTRQARSMENLRFDHRDTRFSNRIETRNHRSSSNFDLGGSWNEQERRENIRSSDRQSKQSRPQAYGRTTLARQAHSVENLKSERRDTRYANRAESRNQRTSSRFEERSELRLPAKLEIDVSRTRETPMSDDRVREIRNRQVRNARIADRSETRSRLALAEVARFRNEFASTKGTKQSFVLNWQHLFYTLQGIYLCGVIVTMMKENPSSHKTRSWWGLSTKAIKVD
ncbi:trichohyalin-like [Amyelois transitella]|uniref:trichohyalin-like n=1 Tax=Amyelois transitella TaxID=680683 RepID=UPI00298FEF88|nr:trichohyalin-like [Amyelois transitella]